MPSGFFEFIPRMFQRAATTGLTLMVLLASAALMVQSASGSQFKVLYRFKGNPEGHNPQYAALIQDAAGNLYGTTEQGGRFDHGVVFKIATIPKVKETVLYSFKGGSDGAMPIAALLMDAHGNLYGTTWSGGAFSAGTVFKITTTPKVKETVLYSFKGGTDGANPAADLILDAKGNAFYGTTYEGGTSNAGTVFKLTKTGEETVLYNFTGGTDGANPSAGLVLDAKGNLYGAAINGGDVSCALSSTGCGVVFKLTKAGRETVLYSFTAGADGDGAFPMQSGNLVLDKKGRIYGTTPYGGLYDSCGDGCGVVFRVGNRGEVNLHGFAGGTDGSHPDGGAIFDAKGNLYGTTCTGGYGEGLGGYGIVFKITPALQETLLHSFGPGENGNCPNASLLMGASGELYGTTQDGGNTNGNGLGNGVVFEITP